MSKFNLDELVNALPTQIAPAQDLWPTIAGRLPAKQHKAHTGWYTRGGLAAAVVLLALVWWQPNTTPASPSLQQLETGYQQQLSQQLTQLNQVDPAFGDWQWQLQLWRQAIAQIRAALVLYPDDPALRAQLIQLYQQQLDYVGTLAHISTLY